MGRMAGIQIRRASRIGLICPARCRNRTIDIDRTSTWWELSAEMSAETAKPCIIGGCSVPAGAIVVQSPDINRRDSSASTAAIDFDLNMGDLQVSARATSRHL